MTSDQVDRARLQGSESASLGRRADADKELATVTATATATVLKVPVPDYMKANAARGLQYVEDGRQAAPGTTDTVLEEAQGLAKGIVSDDKVQRMGPWFERHMSDLELAANSDPQARGWPGPEAVSFLLWGGNPLDPGQSLDWATRQSRVIDEGENY